MIVILGCLVVIGAVLTGFTMAGGHVHALVHPSEVITIGGAALGALIVSNPKKVLVDLLKSVLGLLKGTPFNKATYLDTLKLLYEMFRIGRRDGLLAWESHLAEPHSSELFRKYPRVSGNHHLLDFVCDALSAASDGSATAEQLSGLLESEVKVMEEEHHAAVGALAKTADALPGFGIVAAVLGIVITMQAINGPVEEIGHKVGAALVGTFLGILLSYGFFAPMAGRMEYLGAAEASYFRTIAAAVVGFLDGAAPKAVIDQVRRGIPSDRRPTRTEMEQLFREAEGG